MRQSPAPNAQLKTPKKRAPCPSPTKTPSTVFYNKQSLTPMPAWGESGVKKRLESFDNMLDMMKTQMEGTTFEKKSLQDIIQLQREQSKTAAAFGSGIRLTE
jgi:hypothetical protein